MQIDAAVELVVRETRHPEGSSWRRLSTMAHIVLINPRFEVSYWGLEHALPFLGKKANMPVAALPLLAALTPPEHTVTLLDENVEPIDFERASQADIVGVTGLSVQRFRQREILTALKQRGVFTVAGGAWITVQEDYFGPLADVIFVGEAEETWPRFVTEWQQGRHESRYEQADNTDMTQVPTPRFDLLKMRDYAFGSMQFSRGCPFQCEFCDIIVTFGRRPRLKTSAQVIAEMEALRARHMERIFVVDDNLVGNKKAIKVLLRDLIAWQEAQGYPVMLFTEASIDLADDPELMQLMVEANFVNVFVGIESPNEASLRETKKYQNVRKGPSLLDKVHTIQRAGLEVSCGLILGFDHDDSSIFAAQKEFLKEAHIPHASVGMLHAIPKTPLHARLAAENRLDRADQPEFGTNVIPRQISRQQLRDGYLEVTNDLYAPEAFFERVEDLYLREKFTFGHAQVRYWRHHPWNWFRAQATHLLLCAGLYGRLMWRVEDAALRREYSQRLIRLLRVRREPVVLLTYLIKCAMHYHHYTMYKKMSEGTQPVHNIF
jgi:radical SAM superfamily enzyme YgiQ (UPF0313 family)